MAYKALVLDIDGTLIWRERRHISKAVEQKLKDIQQSGVTVIFATGRAAFACESGVLGTDFVPDYRICANGAYIVDCTGKPVYERYLNEQQISDLTDFAQRNGYPLNLSFEDGYYTYVGHEDFLAYYKKLVGTDSYIKDGSARTRHFQSMPYGAYTTMPPQAAAAFCATHPGIKMMQSVPGSYDISLSDIDKSGGIALLLKQLGIAWRDVVAVGDGENDIDMLRAAGVGIAMGDAPDVVQAAADAVAPNVGDDGVLAVLDRYF